MTNSPSFNPHREAVELRDQLGSDRRHIVFLFGAGTSQAVGIDGIGPLTAKIATDLSGSLAVHYKRIRAELGTASTVEQVLSHVRTCRELLEGRDDDIVRGLRRTDAEELDREVCRAICKRVAAEPSLGLEPHSSFAAWIRSISRAWPVEIFTTNYDVLVERGLEAMETPHFDGFVGTYEPRFSAASVEAEDLSRHDEYRLPRGWVRVWKLHGSVTWRLKPAAGGRRVLVRATDGQVESGDELMIFPTRDKYTESRKLPFIAYHDRFRNVLAGGEVLLVTVGYSYSDQHINETIFEALRWNNRLAVSALLYGDLNDDYRRNLIEPARGFANLTAYSADRAVVGGLEGEWSLPGNAPPQVGGVWPFWDTGTRRFTLGDFRSFANYLRVFMGSRGRAEPAPLTSSGITMPTMASPTLMTAPAAQPSGSAVSAASTAPLRAVPTT